MARGLLQEDLEPGESYKTQRNSNNLRKNKKLAKAYLQNFRIDRARVFKPYLDDPLEF